MDSGLGLAVILAALAGLYFLFRAVKVVPDGHVGIVTRMGGFRSIRQPGRVIIVPIIDRLGAVDMRERSRPERLDATTMDDHVLAVRATVVAQVVDARQAYFSIADVDAAVDALAMTAFRSEIGKVSAAEAPFARQAIAAEVQRQMEAATERWGTRIRRIDGVELTEPG